jgi:hypothetical protein
MHPRPVCLILLDVIAFGDGFASVVGLLIRRACGVWGGTMFYLYESSGVRGCGLRGLDRVAYSVLCVCNVCCVCWVRSVSVV